MKYKKKEFFDSLKTEQDKHKFFGMPLNNQASKLLKGINIDGIDDKKLEEIYVNVLVTEPKEPSHSFMNWFLIEHDSKWKGIFDIIVLILISLSCIYILYSVSFDEIAVWGPLYYAIEGIFGLSIIFAFFHKYQDQETLEIISSYRKIALNYICGWFIIDIISIIPYQLLEGKSVLFKLIRLIRLPKLLQMMDMQRFDRLLDSLFSGSKNDKLVIMYNLRYTYKIIRLVILAIILAYFVGCIWYLFCIRVMNEDENNFIKKYSLDRKTSFEKMVISCYFALTTLTTVGYGDYSAVSYSERIFSICIMLLGVALFSYVMGSFTDHIIHYDKRFGVSDKGSDLQNWLQLLHKFSKNKPFSSDLLNKIDRHFAYFWQHDRNSSISKNDPYLMSLSQHLRRKVIEFLWLDILSQFSAFFLYQGGNEEKYFKFYYDIAFNLLPRRFLPGEFIYKPNEEVEEMYLILEGNVDIGFCLHPDWTNSFETIKSYKTARIGYVIGEYYCLFNVKSNYYYSATSEVKTLGINKRILLTALESHNELRDKMRSIAYRKYTEYIRSVMEKNIKEEIDRYNLQNKNFTIKRVEKRQIGFLENQNGMRIDKFIKKRIEKKNEEISEVIYLIVENISKISEYYENVSRHLSKLKQHYESGFAELEDNLEEVQEKLGRVLDRRDLSKEKTI